MRPVRTVLVSQFGIDAGRLTSNGFGADKPIGLNDTPNGRAQNRRVEFVKQWPAQPSQATHAREVSLAW
ncbi:MAG: hypothetical protein ACRD4C_13195 [Candidatus Acidiferrales bacterium]